MDTATVIITCLLSSTVAAAVVTSIKELVLWRLNRKATVEDNCQQTANEELKEILNEHQECLQNLISSTDSLQKKLQLSLENDKIILKDKIKYLILKYIDIGEITLDEKQAIHHMWHIYHYDLGGNGDLDDLMEMLDEITVVQRHSLEKGAILWRG